ncbi:hypothetical protein SDC9_175229 [bioreactor metagenome]|uniref:Uncharacterized protein n=1 Tax=bioreactor metagenome TaxID=1076179 RepID=A0A645GM46_9ZZZZ
MKYSLKTLKSWRNQYEKTYIITIYGMCDAYQRDSYRFIVNYCFCLYAQCNGTGCD